MPVYVVLYEIPNPKELGPSGVKPDRNLLSVLISNKLLPDSVSWNA